ncbi:MAG: polysaccharide deacetylase family protein [Bacteroidetes bacterium]|nr:polysaccharide deacetylase family protein [Bacteroidota bacterium]
MTIRNFLFHRVSEDQDSMWPPMTPRLFESIVAKLSKNYFVVPLESFLKDTKMFKTKREIATILFDDGYKDNIEIAAPILKKYNCPASFYVVTDCINKNIPTWTYILDNIFANTSTTHLSLEYDFAPDHLKSIPLKMSGRGNELVKQIKPWLKNLSNTKRLVVLQSIEEQCNDVPTPSGKMMNWNDINELATEGFIIGSHSHTHPMLASLEDNGEIESELKISGQIIQENIGSFPDTISYPIGSYDSRVMEIAQKQGYKYGLAVEQRFYNYDKDSLFCIPRVELYEESKWKTSLRMNGLYSVLKRYVGRK